MLIVERGLAIQHLTLVKAGLIPPLEQILIDAVRVWRRA